VTSAAIRRVATPLKRIALTNQGLRLPRARLGLVNRPFEVGEHAVDVDLERVLCRCDGPRLPKMRPPPTPRSRACVPLRPRRNPVREDRSPQHVSSCRGGLPEQKSCFLYIRAHHNAGRCRESRLCSQRSVAALQSPYHRTSHASTLLPVTRKPSPKRRAAMSAPWRRRAARSRGQGTEWQEGRVSRITTAILSCWRKTATNPCTLPTGMTGNSAR